jgi:4-hydroxy-tetrahydrodipicolinate synthase
MTSPMRLDLTGTHVALYTPFDARGEVDVPALEGLATRLVEAGIGLVPCGTTGETPTLSAADYDLVVRTAVRIAGGRVPVIAGTGSHDTRQVIETTRRASELGVDAALVVTPYYTKPPQTSLVAHFTRVAEEGGLPIVLYNVPGRTGCNMLAATTLKLAEHPRILAVKEASGQLEQVLELVQGAPSGFRVLSGDDAWTLPLVLLGGHGVISVAGNVAPRPMKRLVDAALAGDLVTARAWQKRLTPLFAALFATTNPIPLKRAAAILGHARPDLRLPLTADACTEPMLKALEKALEVALAEPG